jgi:hypothetical protein
VWEYFRIIENYSKDQLQKSTGNVDMHIVLIIDYKPVSLGNAMSTKKHEKENCILYCT